MVGGPTQEIVVGGRQLACGLVVMRGVVGLHKTCWSCLFPWLHLSKHLVHKLMFLITFGVHWLQEMLSLLFVLKIS